MTDQTDVKVEEKICMNCAGYYHGKEWPTYNVCSDHAEHVSPYATCPAWRQYQEEEVKTDDT